MNKVIKPAQILNHGKIDGFNFEAAAAKIPDNAPFKKQNRMNKKTFESFKKKYCAVLSHRRSNYIVLKT
jgi:hypothetical protein